MRKIQSSYKISITAMTLIVSSLFVSCNRKQHYAGYRLIEKRFVKEVNAECFYLEHIKSGARLLKIAADDPNKTFSITFKTVPETDAGTPHIMEHAVLEGSKNFPVKSPFDLLAKGSLKTFLNAMTSSDWTMYPVASMNNKDYFNLMHVYLDAVFNPIIYDDPQKFMQEGWHYELTSKDAPLVYKGVIYNEMKGAFSNPESELSFQVMKNLFPANGYSFESGGYPEAIPSLTYEQFLNYHRKYYHPSNSYIFLYGNADLKNELEFIDKEYLSKYNKSDFVTEFPLNPPFDTIKEVQGYYPVIEGAPVEDQTYLSMNYVIGVNTDVELTMALDVLTDILVNQESAPLRKALQDAGIGKDVYAYANNIHQNLFSIVVQNANAGDKDAFKKVINETLKKVVSEGIDKETLKGVLNRKEFNLREGNSAQKGLNYNFQCIEGWLFAGDPFLGLEYEQPLAEVKKSLENKSLEQIIQKDFLNNTYGLLLVLEPKTGLEKEKNAKVEKKLADYKAKLTDEELDSLITTTKKLIAYQQREDTPEALSTIPVLKLEDIDREPRWYDVEAKQINGVQILFHPEFTNNIIYFNSWFDLRVLPQDLLPYASFLSELIGRIGTETYSYETLEKELNIQTGGFRASLNTFLPDGRDENMIPYFTITFKTTKDKLDPAIGLASEIISKTLYSDKDRLVELLMRHQSQLEQQILQDGSGTALSRLNSYLTANGVLNEVTNGAEYYWFITKLQKEFSEKSEEVMNRLVKVAGLLFTKNNMTVGVTCSKDDLDLFSLDFSGFEGTLPDKPVEYIQWNLKPEPKNEAFITASKVQYVLKGYDYHKLGYEWNGKMQVLNKILSSDWLQTRIRVIGGAYGGSARINRNGVFYFSSYRDPNLKETLENYDETPDYLKNFNADSTSMTRYIIGTIAGLDMPLTPSQKGNVAFTNYFSKITKEQLQKERDEILSTTAEDIRRMESLTSGVLEKNVLCVYGNEEKIMANKKLFGNLVVLQK